MKKLSLISVLTFLSISTYSSVERTSLECNVKLGETFFEKVNISFNGDMYDIDAKSLDVEFEAEYFSGEENISRQEAQEESEASAKLDSEGSLVFSWYREVAEVSFILEFDDDNIYLRSDYRSDGPYLKGYYLCEKK